MAPPAQPLTGPARKASKKIPPLTNLAPCVLVPLRDDILNTELSQDPVRRIKWILNTINYQREGIRENLLCMFEREKQRAIQQAIEMEQAQGPPKTRPGLPLSEVDEVIANMEAPAVPGMNYNISSMPVLHPPTSLPPNTSHRDRTVLELLLMVEKGLSQLQGFEKYMADIKQHYLACLERELAKMDDPGRLTEGRSG
ncbi:uncharacterized protein B0T15DRAFT_536440 [Chaetomium strumarium]|uniref:Uncharacterized protein n=1 Tax=Chaetomium strumarium TaxID=1170767 RepID=A0AAJ0GQR5_9PEZI|nr:hypothetical protein B0T15DRAFT_536440 [Chaetomium strumarium]